MSLSRNKNDQTQAMELLAQARLQPEFENYLVEILVNDKSATSDVRAAAGVNLKNSVVKNPGKDRSYLCSEIMKGLLASDLLVRNITGNVITGLFSTCGVQQWPQALTQLSEMARNESVAMHSREAAVGALAKIVEDSKYSLDSEEIGGERPADYVIGQLLGMLQTGMSGALAKFVATCVQAVSQFVPAKTQAMMVHMDEYLAVLFQLAGHPDSGVRKNVCTGFLLVMESRPDKLVPHMSGVVEYCLHLMHDDDESVAMEACEFLLAVAETPSKTQAAVFRSKLSDILPVLLDKMQYSEEEMFLMQLQDEKDDARVADRAEDIRPNIVKSKEGHNAGKRDVPRGQDPDSSDEDDDDDDDDDDLDDELNLWNLRRCAASTLDALSLEYPGDVIENALPILQEKIVSTQWPEREAAILAFGAISKSCIDLAQDKLPTLVPYLVERLRDDESRVRQITCWTISKFALWVSAEAHDGGRYLTYFQPTFEAVVACALDNKKIVQEAACSALATFIENSDVELIAYYTGPLVEHFAKCFDVYQRKNMIMLYDSVSTFVEKIGPVEFGARPEYAATLLPPLFRNWDSLSDTDSALWPLLECVSVVAATMEEAFAPYAVPVYERALRILHSSIALNKQADTHPEIEAPEKDFIVTALDLVDGLVQGLKGHVRELMAEKGIDVLMEMVLACLEDHDEDVRQLAYALLGDFAIHAADTAIEPFFSHIALCAGNEINNYSYGTFPVTNNAIWSFGEMVIRVQESTLAPFIGNMVNLLIPVLNSTDTQQSVLENAAICLGRLGLNGGASCIAPRVSEFIYSWCAQMLYVAENEEKETGFLGMLNIIQSNAGGAFGDLSNAQGKKNLAVFLSCIGNYMNPPDQLRGLFQEFVSSYKEMLGGDWSSVLAMVDADTRAILS